MSLSSEYLLCTERLELTGTLSLCLSIWTDILLLIPEFSLIFEHWAWNISVSGLLPWHNSISIRVSSCSRWTGDVTLSFSDTSDVTSWITRPGDVISGVSWPGDVISRPGDVISCELQSSSSEMITRSLFSDDPLLTGSPRSESKWANYSTV